MHKSALLGLLASSPVSAQLHSLAQAAGLEYFGSAVDNGYLSDAPYKALADDVQEFGQLVPENGQKWDSTEPARDQFTYTGADVVPDLAKKNGQVLRCHALTWHSQLPSWVSSGSFSAEELTTIIETHIANVVGHYKGDCYAWDVVNEAIADDGEWRDSVFYQTLGTDYLAISFNAARKADPDAKLYYNDYNLEYNGAKTDRAVEIVEILQKAGAPIDGVGFQGHLIVGTTPSRSELATAFERFTALNVEVAFTELDIRHASLPASDAALKTQGDDYANAVGACLDVEGCVGVTVWGITDKYSWIPDVFSGAGDALLYNDQYEKKPAWTSVSSVLAAAGTGSPVTTEPAPVETTAAAPVETEATEAQTSAPTTFLNMSVPYTTLQTRTTAAAPIPSEVDDEPPFPTYNIPGNGTETAPTKAPVYDDGNDEAFPTYELPGNGTQAQPTEAPVDDTISAKTEPIPEPEPTVRVPVIRHSSGYSYHWNTETSAPAPIPTGAAPSGTAPAGPIGTGTGGVAKHYYQCGGRNWNGPTECEAPYTCVESNEWYSQCI
ncbi:hypothetical protein F66182_6439 [Fusarium sp. NRRL 66182]|nr:hypothetical protein F66182_6439 [Fusarium sp. NRRL 66182]